VVTHTFIGLYRLALKWGFLEGKNSKKSRKVFKFLMKSLIPIYLVVGSLSLAQYIEIGLSNDHNSTDRYHPTTFTLKEAK
jgi:fumarate reductase subunit C